MPRTRGRALGRVPVLALVAQQPGVGHVAQQVDQAVDEGLVGVAGGQGAVQDGADDDVADARAQKRAGSR